MVEISVVVKVLLMDFWVRRLTSHDAVSQQN